MTREMKQDIMLTVLACALYITIYNIIHDYACLRTCVTPDGQDAGQLSSKAGMRHQDSSEQVVVLDSFDSQARNDARKAAHTHPIAQVTARTADGKRTGHVKH